MVGPTFECDSRVGARICLYQTACQRLSCVKPKLHGASMTPSALLDRHRDAIRQVVADHRALNPRVFGSVSRGEDTEDSDLDLLVDPGVARRPRDTLRLGVDLQHIVDAIERIRTYTADTTEDRYMETPMMHRAIAYDLWRPRSSWSGVTRPSSAILRTIEKAVFFERCPIGVRWSGQARP